MEPFGCSIGPKPSPLVRIRTRGRECGRSVTGGAGSGGNRTLTATICSLCTLSLPSFVKLTSTCTGGGPLGKATFFSLCLSLVGLPPSLLGTTSSEGGRGSASCFASGGSAARVGYNPQLIPSNPIPSTIGVAIFSLLRNIAFNTPSINASALIEIPLAAATCPAATKLAALTVAPTTPDGTDADAVFSANAAASDPQDTARPCRA